MATATATATGMGTGRRSLPAWWRGVLRRPVVPDREAQAFSFFGMFQATSLAASPLPSFFCGV